MLLVWTYQKAAWTQKAIIAIARMVMVSIYHMISERKPFQPTDYEELMNPHNRNERVVLNNHNVLPISKLRDMTQLSWLNATITNIYSISIFLKLGILRSLI